MEFRRQSLVQALSCSMYLKLSKEGYNPSPAGFRPSFETLKCHGGAGQAVSFIERRERLHVPTKAEEPNFFGCRGSEDFILRIRHGRERSEGGCLMPSCYSFL